MNTCSFDGCNTSTVARGLCMRHYKRLRRNGTTKTKSYKGETCPEEHFMDLIDKTGDCWEWLGAKVSIGYGQAPSYMADKYNEHLAHRVSYIIHNGSIPKWEGYSSLCVMHSCDNPGCVNPSHLSLGTHQDNMKDRDEKGRQLRGERHHSAVFTEEDVLLIRERLSNGERPSDIAREKKVTFRSIGMIRDRLTWKHI